MKSVIERQTKPLNKGLWIHKSRAFRLFISIGALRKTTSGKNRLLFLERTRIRSCVLITRPREHSTRRHQRNTQKILTWKELNRPYNAKYTFHKQGTTCWTMTNQRGPVRAARDYFQWCVRAKHHDLYVGYTDEMILPYSPHHWPFYCQDSVAYQFTDCKWMNLWI